MGLTTPDHVWILPSYFDPDWWRNSDTNCTNEEMKDALESVIFVGPVKYSPFLLSRQVSEYTRLTSFEVCQLCVLW